MGWWSGPSERYWIAGRYVSEHGGTNAEGHSDTRKWCRPPGGRRSRQRMCHGSTGQLVGNSIDRCLM